MSAVSYRRRTLGEIAFNVALDGAIRAVIGAIDAVRLARKMRRRYEARHVKLRHVASRKR